MALLREYLDPQTGQPLDPAALRVGQVVRVRLTAVVGAQHSGLALEDPLPAGAELVSPGTGDFARATAAAGALALERGASGPGIYQHSYLLRLVAAGRYGVPAATASAPGGGSGASSPATLEISAP